MHARMHARTHKQQDAGLWGSLMIFLGLIGATIASLIADYTKKFKEIAVFTLAMAILCMIWFMEVSLYPSQCVVSFPVIVKSHSQSLCSLIPSHCGVSFPVIV